MNKRGRPKQDGRRVLERVILAVYAYGKARGAGEKHSVALSEAVQYIRDKALGLRISVTEVKRIVADWRPKGSASCLLVDKPRPEQSLIPALRGGIWSYAKIFYTVSWGPRPVYSRANAAQKPGQSDNSDSPTP